LGKGEEQRVKGDYEELRGIKGIIGNYREFGTYCDRIRTAKNYVYGQCTVYI
jgi:hypothetical protein